MQTTEITTELMVDEMQKSLDFYTDLLGFKIVTAVPEENPFFAIIKNGTVEIMFYERKAFVEEIPDFDKQKLGGTIALYMGIKNLKAEYERVKNQVEIIQNLHKTDYGTEEFSFYDCNGYVLMMHS
ncbi:VOC family protein [Candidatus Dojkabacteria bacterium]|uniref:VOC family protein n=1 Tax=Candidatus Dojkabacteria bacterium TaxID=2099670 RepID=A0A955RIC0_9BACT|nr:VOC family protein [Candidatus Dojkabacteria bacterium]